MIHWHDDYRSLSLGRMTMQLTPSTSPLLLQQNTTLGHFRTAIARGSNHDCVHGSSHGASRHRAGPVVETLRKGKSRETCGRRDGTRHAKYNTDFQTLHQGHKGRLCSWGCKLGQVETCTQPVHVWYLVPKENSNSFFDTMDSYEQRSKSLKMWSHY